jgi:hypothetical protein
MPLTNRDFTLDDEDIQQSRQEDSKPFLSRAVEEDDEDEEYGKPVKRDVMELSISDPMKLRLMDLGFHSLDQLQKETTASLIQKGLPKYDARDTANAMGKIGMPMQKAAWGTLIGKLKKNDSLSDVEESSTPLDALDVTVGIKNRLINVGLKRPDQIQKQSRDSMIELGLSQWDAQIISAAMSRIGHPIQRKEGSPFSKTTQKLNRTMPQTKRTLHWTQTPEGKVKMAGIRAKATQAIQEKVGKQKHWSQTPRGRKKMAEIASARYKKEGQTAFVSPKETGLESSSLDSLHLSPMTMKLLKKANIDSISKLLQKSYKEVLKLMKPYFTKKITEALDERGLHLRKEKISRKPIKEEEKLVLHIPTGEGTYVTEERQEYFGYILGYAHSDILQRINVISESTGGKVSEAELAIRLGRLLQGEKMR